MDRVNQEFIGNNCIPSSLCEQNGCGICEYSIIETKNETEVKKLNKKWYESKTLWANLIATGAILAQTISGHDIIPAEQQVIILSVINFILRLITKDQITW